jgi:hypothetical protein
MVLLNGYSAIKVWPKARLIVKNKNAVNATMRENPLLANLVVVESTDIESFFDFLNTSTTF